MLIRLFAISAMLLMTVATGAAQAETITIKFKDKTDAKDWRPITEKWGVEDSAYGATELSGDKSPFSIYQSKSFSDAEVTFTADADEKRYYIAGNIRTRVERERISGYQIVAFFSSVSVDIYLYRLDEFPLDPALADEPRILCHKLLRKVAKPKITLAGKGDTISVIYDGDTVCSEQDKKYDGGKVGLFNHHYWMQGYTAVKIVTP